MIWYVMVCYKDLKKKGHRIQKSLKHFAVTDLKKTSNFTPYLQCKHLFL